MYTQRNKNKGFTKIEKLVSQTAKQYNLETALYRHQTIKYWQDVAAAFVEEAKQYTQAIDFKKGVLTVACLSREVAFKIKLMSEKIISALNELVGKPVVYAIFIEL